ncbi:MAG: TonB-dependent receptor plug domain-containing protein [Rhodanobacter sp.]
MHTFRRNALQTALLLSGCVLATPSLVFAQDAGATPPAADAAPAGTAQSTQSTGKEKDAIDLQGLVVSGAIEYRSHIDVPAPVLVYDQKFFAKFEPVSVGDQLRRVPGVAFVGDIGESVAPEMRGLGHGYTQILVNGRPVPGIGNDRSVAVDRIPAEIIDRIEIIRSPSADMDSQGVGGTINIILKDGATLPPGVILRVGETWDKKTGNIRPNAAFSWSGHNNANNVFYSLTVDAQKRFNEKHSVQEIFDGDSAGFDDEVARGGMGRSLQSWDDRTRSVSTEREEQGDQRSSRDLSFNGDLTWNMSDDSTLRLDAYSLTTHRKEWEDTVTYEGDGSVGGLDLSDPKLKFEDVRTNEKSKGLSATFDSALNDLTDFEAHIGRDDINGDTTKTKFKKTRDNKDSREIERAEETDWQGDVSLSRHMPDFASAIGIQGAVLKVGLQGQYKDRDYNLSQAGDLGDDEPSLAVGQFGYRERRLDGYAKVDWDLTSALTVTTGLRSETTRTKQDFINTTSSGSTVNSVKTGNADSKTTMLNPSLHAQWKVSDTDQFRFSVARTVRRPSIDQLVPSLTVDSPEDYDITVGNPDLDMERSLGFDLGYEHGIGKSGVFGVNVFTRKISNLIGLVKTDRPVTDVGEDPDEYTGGLYTYQNIGSGKVHGVEFDVSMPLSFMGWNNTGVFANYTRLFSSRPSPINGRDIAVDDQPSYVYNVGLTQDIPAWKASFGVSYQDQGASNFVSIGEMERTQFDGNLELFLEKRLGKAFVLRLTGSNLLDACSYQVEPNFDGDSAAEIIANQAAYHVDHFEVERECSSPRWSLTLRAVF